MKGGQQLLILLMEQVQAALQQSQGAAVLLGKVQQDDKLQVDLPAGTNMGL